MNPAQNPARPLAAAHLSALELAPPEWTRVAARAGFAAVGLRLYPVAAGGIAYASNGGSAGHRELLDTLAGEGITVHDVEFIPVVPELNPASLSGLFEAASSLSARWVSVSGDDPDFARLAAKLADMAERAQPFGLRIDLEFMCWRHVGSLAQTRDVTARASHPNLALLVDALHLSRAGGMPDDIAALAPDAIGFVQHCDAPAVLPAALPAALPISDEDAILEARTHRLAPGDGALPLDALLRALPAQVALSVETPMPSLPVAERIELAYRATRRLVDRVETTERPTNPKGTP